MTSWFAETSATTVRGDTSGRIAGRIVSRRLSRPPLDEREICYREPTMGDDSHVLLDEGWALWRRFVVRGAGFAETAPLALALSDALAPIDALLELQGRIDAASTELEAVCARDGRTGDRGQWKRASKAIRRILAGEAVAIDDGVPPSIVPSLAALKELVAQLPAKRAEAARAFEADLGKLRVALAAVAGEARFREAVTWQNRSAVNHSFDPLRDDPSGDLSWKARRRRRLAAIYLQRYCYKAETIGFFGPVGWGSFAGRPGAQTELRCGPTLLARRRVYFEYWTIDALAQNLAARPEMRPWLAPRRVPTVRIPDDARLARLVGDCDGERSARELAAQWRKDPELGLADEDEAYRLLAGLVEQGALYWTLEVPIGDQYPERSLRRLLEAIGDEPLRRAALAALDELEERRSEVQAAAGDPDALARALDRANEAFTRLTGQAAERNPGRMYGARTILYEDCIRDAELTLGAEPLARLSAPLALVLESGRWFTHRVVTGFRELFGEVYAALRSELGSDEVDYLRFWERIAPYMAGGSAVQTGKRSSVGNQAEEELQARWTRLLELSPEQRRRDYTTEQLRPLVRSAFEAPHSGAAPMREHAPDLCIAAASVEAIARGDYFIVLSELHTGANTFTKPPFIDQCPFPEELLAAMARDLPEPELFPVSSKEMFLPRISPPTYKENDVHFENGTARSWLPRARVLAAADLFVKSVEGRLVVGHRGDARTFDIADFLQSSIIRSTIQSFSVAPVWPHSPRITIDKLVIARETWRANPKELPFLALEDEFERFLAVRRWARKLGLPRFVFFKTPEERKPTWVDLESAVYVDTFCHLARKGSRLVLTEMLPEIGQSWLADADGNRYACELRMVAVDPKVAGAR
jgi:hypothetical protein